MGARGAFACALRLHSTMRVNASRLLPIETRCCSRARMYCARQRHTRADLPLRILHSYVLRRGSAFSFRRCAIFSEQRTAHSALACATSPSAVCSVTFDWCTAH
eukprot:IDg11506t1